MAATPAAKLQSLLCCPNCHGAMPAISENARSCAACGVTAEISGAQVRCGGFTVADVKSDWLNELKEAAKRALGTKYQWAINQISPVYPGFLQRRLKRYFAGFDLQRDVVVDLGSGPLRLHPDLICCDGMNYANVNLVADLERLPLPANSLDGLISIAVLEHVIDPPSTSRKCAACSSRAGVV